LAQNKIKQPINTPIALMDLATHIYDKKNKHKLGNNIFNRDKIMVNSPRMHFDITRQ
jgi:hypothetical protein